MLEETNAKLQEEKLKAAEVVSASDKVEKVEQVPETVA